MSLPTDLSVPESLRATFNELLIDCLQLLPRSLTDSLNSSHPHFLVHVHHQSIEYFCRSTIIPLTLHITLQSAHSLASPPSQDLVPGSQSYKSALQKVMLSAIMAGLSPNSQEGVRQTITAGAANKRRKSDMLDDEIEITLDDMSKLYVAMHVKMSNQAKKMEELEKEVRRLTSTVATLSSPTTPSLPAPSSIPAPSSSLPATSALPAPPSVPPPRIITLDDDEMVGSSTSSATIPYTKTTQETALDKNPIQIPPVETSTDLERSLVIARLPIDRSNTAQQQVQADYDQVVTMSALIGYPVLPLAVYRMPIGEPESNFPRLTKVLMPTRQHARLFLRNWRLLKDNPHFGDVYVRESIADPKDRKKTPPSKIIKRNFTPPSNNQYSNPNPPPPAPFPQSIIPRQRLDSVFTNRTDRTHRRAQPNKRNGNWNRHQYPPQDYRRQSPFSMTHPQMHYPTPLSYPIPSQFPNPFISHISHYGAPPNYGLQGNW